MLALLSRWEEVLDVDLAEGLSERAVGGLKTALPAGPLLGLAAELLAEEMEVFFIDGLGKRVAGDAVDQLPTQIGLDGVEIGGSQQGVAGL